MSSYYNFSIYAIPDILFISFYLVTRNFSNLENAGRVFSLTSELPVVNPSVVIVLTAKFLSLGLAHGAFKRPSTLIVYS